jgi:hypothetical protein
VLKDLDFSLKPVTGLLMKKWFASFNITSEIVS